MNYELQIKKQKIKACPAKRGRCGGYTIIETMIAISLFIIIVMMGMDALLNANLLRQKSQSMRSVMDSLNFTMEDMSRNLRTGYNYQCFDSDYPTLSPATLGSPRSCSDPAKLGWAIAFEYQNGVPLDYTDQWAYYISNDGKIFKSVDGANSFVQLTPDEVVIDTTKSSFSVSGAEAGDGKQPFVTIKLVGKIITPNFETPFSLQTSVSERLIDIGI